MVIAAIKLHDLPEEKTSKAFMARYKVKLDTFINDK
jgi:hypothetical protein